jgi:hypothetical protein
MDAQLDPYAYIGRLEQLVRDQMATIATQSLSTFFPLPRPTL